MDFPRGLKCEDFHLIDEISCSVVKMESPKGFKCICDNQFCDLTTIVPRQISRALTTRLKPAAATTTVKPQNYRSSIWLPTFL